jgi:hypothetical protein
MARSIPYTVNQANINLGLASMGVNPMLTVNPDNFVSEISCEIKILDTYTVLEALEEATTTEPFTTPHAVELQEWCEYYNVHFYSKPGEDFNRIAAWCRADKAKATYLLMENLS